MNVWRRSPAEDQISGFIRAVYAEHAPALLSYVTRLTGDRSKAEDIVQETVLRAWRHAEQLGSDDRPLRPWLFTVAARLVVDDRRARGSRPHEVNADLLDLMPAADRLDRMLDHWQVMDALNTLSPAHRQAIVETYYRGHSVNEAALVLGVPPGTVKSRAYYALRALRLALEERGWTP
jgi:RNA polymerase sigma-70 factor, ECF subfamily